MTRDSVRPAISAQLVSDTTGPGGTNTDKISSDVRVSVLATDNRAITDFRAAIDPPTTIPSPASFHNFNRTVRSFSHPAMLDQLAGGTLADGPHTLVLFARDAANNFDQINFTFTLDSSTPQPTIQIDSNFDTGQKGDLQTAITPIILVGTAEPGAQVTLVGTGRTANVTPEGTYSFDNITLSLGDNSFTVQVTDRAGNVAQRTVNVVGLPALGDVELPTLSRLACQRHFRPQWNEHRRRHQRRSLQCPGQRQHRRRQLAGRSR